MVDKKLEERYRRITGQLEQLFQKTENKVARMATIASLLHHKMPKFFWTGFYVLSEGQLTVGPYQGPLACLVLEKKERSLLGWDIREKNDQPADSRQKTRRRACFIAKNKPSISASSLRLCLYRP